MSNVIEIDNLKDLIPKFKQTVQVIRITVTRDPRRWQWELGHDVPLSVGPAQLAGECMAITDGRITQAWFRRLNLMIQFEYIE